MLKASKYFFYQLIHLFRDTLRPFIEAQTCGIKKCSVAKDATVSTPTAPNTTIIPWREHLFFEPRNMVSAHTLQLITLYNSTNRISNRKQSH